MHFWVVKIIVDSRNGLRDADFFFRCLNLTQVKPKLKMSEYEFNPITTVNSLRPLYAGFLARLKIIISGRYDVPLI